jgi:hypothetical protein
MKWITRERAKVDRIACPWLISRFIDPQPEFFYVLADQVLPKQPHRVPFSMIFLVWSWGTRDPCAASTR